MSHVIARAKEVGIKWPLDKPLSDQDIQLLLFPRGNPTDERLMPDYEAIDREFRKRYITLKLLWMEYVDACLLQGGKPLMYTQFCL